VGLAAIAGLLLQLLLRERAQLRGRLPALGDERVRSQVVAELVRSSPGIQDSFIDADVSKVLQPNVPERTVGGVAVSSNRFGMREVDYSLPRDNEGLRVVLLGDSFVFGHGVEADERFGVKLRRLLMTLNPHLDEVECLHLAISSWNIVSECSFVRRQLGLLRPDLVVQVLTLNDLEDCAGVRGFGESSRFSPQRRSRGDGAMITGRLETGGLLIPYALDYEGRSRIGRAAEQIEALVKRIESLGGEYLAVVDWRRASSVAREQLLAFLSDEQVLYLPNEFTANPEHHVSVEDQHWNPMAQLIVAELLYGVIQKQGLLAKIELAPNLSASPGLEALRDQGRQEASQGLSVPFLATLVHSTKSSLEFPLEEGQPLPDEVHCGIDRRGEVAPYAAVILARKKGRRLQVEGAFLERPEIEGTRIEVFVDELRAESMVVIPGQPVALDVELPEQVMKRPFLSVRFAAQDYCYSVDLRRCLTFQLQRVALTP
jgi:hypothetical protein